MQKAARCKTRTQASKGTNLASTWRHNSNVVLPQWWESQCLRWRHPGFVSIVSRWDRTVLLARRTQGRKCWLSFRVWGCRGSHGRENSGWPVTLPLQSGHRERWMLGPSCLLHVSFSFSSDPQPIGCPAHIQKPFWNGPLHNQRFYTTRDSESGRVAIAGAQDTLISRVSIRRRTLPSDAIALFTRDFLLPLAFVGGGFCHRFGHVFPGDRGSIHRWEHDSLKNALSLSASFLFNPNLHGVLRLHIDLTL